MDNKTTGIGYYSSTLPFVNKLLLVCEGNQEQVFWILTGLIKAFPKLFVVDSSVLIDNVQSKFRYEFNAFKALIKQDLPKIYQKFRELGFSLEFLVYESFKSFYADFFSNDVVFRLWDVIFLKFSSKNFEDKKKGIWYLLAPAYLILKEK